MITRYIIPSRVRSVEEKSRAVSGMKDAVTGKVTILRENLGWFILLDNGYSVSVGKDKPPCEIDAEVKLVLEVPHGQAG